MRKSKCRVWSKRHTSEKTENKAKSTKLRPRKLQLSVKQHTDNMNILRGGAPRLQQGTKFRNFTSELRLGKTV